MKDRLKGLLSGRNLVTVILVGIILVLWFTRPAPEVVNVDHYVEVEAALGQDILDSLAKVDSLVLVVDSLEGVIASREDSLAVLVDGLSDALQEIDDNSVEEDVDFFVSFHGFRDTVRIYRLSSRVIVGITPGQLKENNRVLVMYRSLQDQYALMESQNSDLRRVIDREREVNAALRGTIMKQDERYNTCNERGNVLADNNKTLKRKNNIKKWVIPGGIIGGFLLGFIIAQ